MNNKFISSKVWIGVLISLITALGLMATDIYAPAMPAVTKALMTSSHAVQLTVTIFLIATGFSQLIYGPLSDHWGRRPLLIAGIIIYFFGSLVCACATDISFLLLGRFIQGLGAGGVMALNRVIIRDTFSGRQLSIALSYIGAFIALAPAVAPALGGFIQMHGGWRWNFIFLLIYSLIISILAWFTLPESNKDRLSGGPSLKGITNNYALISKNRNFWANVICSGLALAAMITCATVNPFILENTLGKSPAMYGFLAMISCSGFFIGMLTNTRLVDRLGVHRTLYLGTFIIFAMGLAFILTGLLHIFSISAIVIPTIGIEFGIALVFPNAFTGAIAPFHQIAGAAGALYGFLQVVISFLTSLIVAAISSQTQLPMGILLLSLGLIGFTAYFLLSEKSPAAESELATS